eukprot:747490-Hanusia_phi.AAC.2
MLRQEQNNLKSKMQQDTDKKTRRKAKKVRHPPSHSRIHSCLQKSSSLSKVQDPTQLAANYRKGGTRLRYADTVAMHEAGDDKGCNKSLRWESSLAVLDDDFFESLIEREQKLLEIWQQVSDRKENSPPQSEDKRDSDWEKLEKRVSLLEEEMKAAKQELQETVRANCRSQTLIQLLASKVAVLQSEAPSKGSVQDVEELLQETARRVEEMHRRKIELDEEAKQLRRQVHANEVIAQTLQGELEQAVDENQLAILQLKPRDLPASTRPTGREAGEEAAASAEVLTLQAQLDALREELVGERKLAKLLEEENREMRREGPAASPDVLLMMQKRGKG